MSSNLTLHTVKGCPFSLMAMNALTKAGLTFEVKVCEKKDLHSKEFKTLNPLATVPVLQTENGTVCGTATIVRWVGRNKAELYGSNPEEQAQVDQWIDVLTGDVFPGLNTLNRAMWGVHDVDKKVVKNQVKESMKQLEFMDRLLKDKTYLVNEKYSLADVVAANVLDRFFRFVLNSKKRSKLSNLSEYVKRVVNETPLLRKLEYSDQKFNMLKVDLEKQKKEAAEKKKKEQEAKKKEQEANKPKKYTYPKSDLNFNDFKFYVANEKDSEKRVKYILDNVDLNAFSFFHLTYDKLPNQCTVDFRTKNLCHGFLQRCEFFRDQVYGVHCVVGDNNEYDINGVWLWRGTDKLVCIDENPLAEYYFYKKLDPSKEEDRKMIADYFSLSNEDWGTKKLNGQTLVYHEEYK